MINNNKNNKTNNNDRTNDKRYNIYVVSFSDNVDEEKIEEVLNAKERFEKYGFNVVLGKSLCDNSKENISYDLEQIEKNEKDIDIVFCSKGGDSETENIQHVKMEKLKDKIVIGFSDNTIILNFMYIYNNNRSIHYMNFKEYEKDKDILKLKKILESDLNNESKKIIIDYNTIRKGRLKGNIIGGNLTIFSRIITHFKTFKNRILLLEDLDIETDMKNVEKVLDILEKHNVFEEISGIIIGNYGCERTEKQRPFRDEILKRITRNIPVIENNMIGHVIDMDYIIIGREIDEEV
jgi:peptidase U61 LD-carboxypeptidase A